MQTLNDRSRRNRHIVGRWRGYGEPVFARLGVTREQLEALQQQLGGRIVLPGDPSYQVDRALFNPRYCACPAAIVYCSAEHDVELCLDLVRRHAIAFSLRSGGHSIAGFSASSGVILDLSQLDHICVDAVSSTVTAGCGVSNGALERALAQHKLHIPLGDSEGVRVGGFLQGGGWGYTSRTYGMNSDNVLDMRVLLADGRVVHASETVNHDLWWALRGGCGGNFGVLLEARYRLHRAGEQNGWCLAWRLARGTPNEQAVAALLAFQECFMRPDSPREMNAGMLAAFAADEAHGARTPRLILWGTYVGRRTQMIELLRPILALSGWEQMPWPGLISLPAWPFDRGSRFVARTLDAADWRMIIEHFLNTPNEFSALHLDVAGGAINAYPIEGSAFIHRQALFNIYLDVYWESLDDEPVARSYLSAWYALMNSYWNGHIYQNFPSLDTTDYQWSYWGEAYPALAEVKRKYDPHALFSNPQMIVAPSGTAKPATWPFAVIDALKRPIQISDVTAI